MILYEIILSQLGHQWARKLAMLVTSFSLIVIIYNASYLFYHLRSPERYIESDIIKLSDPTTKLSVKDDYLEMFGHFEAQIASQKFIPVSALDIVLVSIMYSAFDANESLALLRKNNDQDGVYHLHDELFPGIVIDKILSDKIIVNNNGKLEMIKLPEEQIDFTLLPVRG